MNIRSRRRTTTLNKNRYKGRDKTKHIRNRRQKSDKLNTTALVISIIASVITTLYTLLQLLVELKYKLK
ncbi:hypothetical protein [Metaclostridioides mangenotii]|uniref:hypothetical protein n=1 Tax=Metaclostridioides mangenotii TaxID=1540 RepID=UPI000464C2B2|nr:hypothetical protein [Clostridioides mangenotii]